MRIAHTTSLFSLAARVLVAAAFLFMLLLGHTSEALAQGNFVYVNNNSPGPNTVSAFAVGADCALTPVAGSPFVTGGGGASTTSPRRNERRSAAASSMWPTRSPTTSASSPSTRPRE